VAWFETGTFRSERGHHTARAIVATLDHIDTAAAVVPAGRAYSVLRETRMAAVVCAFAGDDATRLARALSRSAELGAAITEGVRRAFEEARISDPAIS
jgi:hypothetical protein